MSQIQFHVCVQKLHNHIHNSERIITRRMDIAKCVSFCNQPKAHYLAISRESRRQVQAFGYVKRVRHILASPGYVPGTIAVNVTWMERGFNADQMHRSMHLQPFTSYSEILVGNCNFFLPPLAFNAPVGMFPLEFWGKV